ncbi:MAG: hypothetical protein ACJA0U_002139, partial [Salibacteraceae bacterium]
KFNYFEKQGKKEQCDLNLLGDIVSLKQ